MSPIISFVTPTRDRPDLLRETLRSLSAQTLAAWEAIVVDDGSSPVDLQQAREQADDPRVRIIVREDPPSGANHCRNIGFASARSDLIVFLDDDDLMSPTCAEARVSFMSAHPSHDFAVFPHRHFKRVPGDCATAVFARNGKDHIAAYLSARMPWQTSGPVWRRSFLEKVGPWNESLPCWQDWELTVRALSLTPSYACVAGPAYWHRLTTSDRASISMRGLTPERLAGQEHAIREGCAALVARGLMTTRRRRLSARLLLFVAERWKDLDMPERARGTWHEARTRGLVRPAAYRLALTLIDRAGSRPVRAAIRRVVWGIL